jgi:iron complex outermembrane receptor protein
VINIRITILVLVVWFGALGLPISAQENDIYRLDKEVIVTASKSPISLHELARSVVILDKETIANTPVRSIEGLLMSGLGGDVRRRGPSGVQADIGIRGGSFQQTLILIDGIRTNDPQTGHHNLDLPVTLADVSRIEILKGPGAKLYGPNAMNGVINIITERASANRLHVETAAGRFGLFERLMALSYSHGVVSHRLSLNRRNSTGYRDNTEFDITNVSYNSNIRTGSGYISLFGGYGEKQFGAHQYYSNAFPDEWEATTTKFLSLRSDQKLGRVSFTHKIFWRNHKDNFVLDRNRPEWYRNIHSTDQYGLEIQTSLETNLGISIIGGEVVGEDIESSNLGKHSRTRGGIFIEQQIIAGSRLSIIPGFSLYNHQRWGWQIWPGLDIGYQFIPSARIFFSVGKSHRIPTFTELYYKSPSNMGNPHLRAERMWAYELGINLRYHDLSAQLSAFINRGANLIDWVKADAADPWKARNISRHTTGGFEVGAEYSPSAVWNWFTRSSGDYLSKYLLDHLQHQLVVDLDKRWYASLSNRWTLRYTKRFQDTGYLTVDGRISWKIGDMELFTDVTNLFNTSYTEVGTIPMPGRWLRIGFRYDLGLYPWLAQLKVSTSAFL